MRPRILLTLLALLVPAMSFADDTAAQPLFIVHFETGASWNSALPPAEQNQFREHSANLKGLREDGSIVFGARYGELGVIIIQADSLEAVTALISADPGVQSGIFNFHAEALRVFYPWKHESVTSKPQG